MIYLVRYELKSAGLAKHLAIKDKIEIYFGNNQRHIMRTTFIIKSNNIASTIFNIIQFFIESYGITKEDYEILVTQITTNRFRMKYTLDKESEKWIHQNIEGTQILALNIPKKETLRKHLQKFLDTHISKRKLKDKQS